MRGSPAGWFSNGSTIDALVWVTAFACLLPAACSLQAGQQAAPTDSPSGQMAVSLEKNQAMTPDNIPDLPATGDTVAMLRHHVRALSEEIGERSVVRGDGLARARAYIHRGFGSAGLSVREQTYDYNARRVANLIADLPGAKPHPAPYIVGAHYDTAVGTPGADDNASAVAVMLELARRAAAKPPPVPVRFVAFTLEEPPNHHTDNQGSRVFVRRLQAAGETVSGAVILEMVGLTTLKQAYPVFLKWAGYPEAGNFIGVVGNGRSRAFGERLLGAMRENPALPVESLFVWFNGWVLPDTRLSDHAPFWDSGMPAVMVTDTAYFRNPNYHGPGDRWDTLDYSFMTELVNSLELAINALPAPGLTKP